MKVIAFAGKKESGKSTKLSYTMAQIMCQEGIIDSFKMNDNGELFCTALFYDEKGNPYTDMGIFSFYQNSPEFYEYMERNVYPTVKNYDHARFLKQLGMMFGLSWDQCYGSNEQKNSLTSLNWEDMPGVVPEGTMIGEYNYGYDDLAVEFSKIGIKTKSGKMSARDFLQYFGTEVYRKIDKDFWPKMLKDNILTDNSNYALVGDLRYRNEFESLKEMGATLVYLTRAIHNDSHQSENDLTPDGFDIVIDNQNMTIEESNSYLNKKLLNLGIFKPLKKERFTTIK
ncbi:MAG: hypothetical protein ACHQ1D_00310 [Nitrososphaerales archaeon]